MNLEITIKVPLVAAGVSVERQITEPQTLPAVPEWEQGPPPVQLIEAMTRPDLGTAEVAEPTAVARPGEVVHEPPSPAEFGSPTVAADVGPPPLELIDQVATAGTTNGPPGLEGVPDPQLAESLGAMPEPPDLPDPSEVPPVSEEFAPPPVEDVKPGTSRRKTTRKTAGRSPSKERGKS